MTVTTTERQDRLLAVLLTANSLKEAAAKAGVPYESARRYLREPDFQAALAEMRQAGETLAAIMADESAPPHARVRAAEAALNYERAVAELFDVHERLTAVEAALAGQQAA